MDNYVERAAEYWEEETTLEKLERAQRAEILKLKKDLEEKTSREFRYKGECFSFVVEDNRLLVSRLKPSNRGEERSVIISKELKGVLLVRPYANPNTIGIKPYRAMDKFKRTFKSSQLEEALEFAAESIIVPACQKRTLSPFYDQVLSGTNYGNLEPSHWKGIFWLPEHPEGYLLASDYEKNENLLRFALEPPFGKIASVRPTRLNCLTECCEETLGIAILQNSVDGVRYVAHKIEAEKRYKAVKDLIIVTKQTGLASIERWDWLGSKNPTFRGISVIHTIEENGTWNRDPALYIQSLWSFDSKEGGVVYVPENWDVLTRFFEYIQGNKEVIKFPTNKDASKLDYSTSYDRSRAFAQIRKSLIDLPYSDKTKDLIFE
jgi:hypothetical protein